MPDSLFADREPWLAEASHLLLHDHILPLMPALPAPPVRVPVGYPRGSRGGRSSFGACYPRAQSADGSNEIYISPELSDPYDVLSVLAHELCHAADDCRDGHRGRFVRLARGIGLEGPLTATHAGAELVSVFAGILQMVGTYPHAALHGRATKQTVRQRKCQCDQCGLIARMAASTIAVVSAGNGGIGWCPACGTLSLSLDV